MRPELILASASPRRLELLSSLGLEFTCRPSDVDESPRPDEEPEAYVRRLALEKATAEASAGEIILAADTTVVVDGELLGKPSAPEDAARMLAALSGRQHLVLTGVALYPHPDTPIVETCRTTVTMATMSSEQISWYVASGEPSDKAGAYAIQGLGALFVERIDGNYSNVVGLPLSTVFRLFEKARLDLFGRCRLGL